MKKFSDYVGFRHYYTHNNRFFLSTALSTEEDKSHIPTNIDNRTYKNYCFFVLLLLFFFHIFTMKQNQSLIERLVSKLFTPLFRQRRRKFPTLLAATALTAVLACDSVYAQTSYVWNGTTWAPAFSGTLTNNTIFNISSGSAVIGNSLSGGYSITKQGAGSLTLSGNNTFTGGTTISEGTLILDSATALGTWVAGNPALTKTGMLLAIDGASTVQILDDLTVTNHFQLGRRGVSGDITDPNATLTFDIASGKTLLIDGVVNTSTDTYLGVGGAINVNVPGADVGNNLIFTSPLNFSGGSLILSNNQSYEKGGAVGSLFNKGGTQYSVLNFTELESLTFEDNIAGYSGNGEGGGIYSYTEYNSASPTTSSLSFGNDVTFSRNIAGYSGNGSGGGIYSGKDQARYSILSFGDRVKFEDNIAGNTGDGYGGAIYSQAYFYASLMTFGNDIEFTNNIAGKGIFGYGGGIYSRSMHDSFLTFGNGVKFSNNIAGNGAHGEGGAIYSRPTYSASALTFGDNIEFSSNTAGNGTYGKGGAIYSGVVMPMNMPNTYSSLSFGNHITFSDNIAGNGSYGEGGAIYSYGEHNSFYSFYPYSSLSFGDYVTFSDNIAGNDGYGLGGAIYSKSVDSYSNLLFGRYATFSDNIAGKNGYGNGGVIFSSGDSTSTTNFGSNVYFTDNHAGGNDEGGLGGVLYQQDGNVTFRGDTYFENNLVSRDTTGDLNDPGSHGGAIYMLGNTGSILTLDTNLYTLNSSGNYVPTGSSAPIAFSGNKINVDMGTMTGGNINSIHLEKNTKLEIKGNGNVYFDDPISSGSDGNNSLIKTGTGFVQFADNSVLNPDNKIGGEVTISEGTFRIVDGASFTTGGNDSKMFNVTKTDATTFGTLAGGGTITSLNGFMLSGKISPDSDRFLIPTFVVEGDSSNGATTGHYNFFLNDKSTTVASGKKIGTLTLVGNTTFNNSIFDVDLGASNVSDKINVTGGVLLSGNHTINIETFVAGTYDLIVSSTTVTGFDVDKFTIQINDNTLSVRQTATVQLVSNNIVQLKTTQGNTNLTWTGAGNSNWFIGGTVKDWTNDDNLNIQDVFIDGDRVHFRGSGSGTITLLSDVVVVDMIVSGANDYTFVSEAGEDNGITGTTNASLTTLSSPTGKLIKSGTGTLTLNTTNEFEGGAEISEGTIVLGNDKALGTWIAGDPTTAKKGMLLAVTGDSTIKILDDRTITNHFQLGTTANRTGTLTFDIAADKTLTISNVENTSTNDHIGRGGAINLNVYTINPTDNSPLRFIGGGNLIFSDNRSQAGGGAVGAFSNTTNGHIVLDFNGLSSIMFENNRTLSNDTYGGGICANALVSGASALIKLGDNVAFSGNIAGTSGEGKGGGIFSFSYALDSSVQLGDDIDFTGNVAGNVGNGEGGGIYSRANNNSSVLLGSEVTFTDNIAGQTNGSTGGAIYSYASSNISLIQMDNHIVFSGNIAGNNGSGDGGAIYSYSYHDLSSIILGNDVLFIDNIAGNGAGGQGGAIYSRTGLNSALSSMQLGDRITFLGNIAGNKGQGNGGAIYSYPNLSSTASLSSLELGTNVYFKSNRAGGNNLGGNGGAIYINHSLSISGDTFFEDNLASQGSGSLGGAIYISDYALYGQKTAILNANTGTIAFKGNKINVNTSDPNNPTGGDANSVHLGYDTKLDLRGDSNIYFDDPISSGTSGKNSLTKSGSGFVQFIGSNVLNTTGFVGANSVDIIGGTFRVVNNGTSESFDATGAGAFKLATGTTLAGHGMIETTNGFTISGTISPDADRFEIPEYVDMNHAEATVTNYNYFKPGRTIVANNKKISTLILDGDVIFDGATIDVDLGTSDTSDMIIVSGGSVTSGSGTNTVNITTFEVGNFELVRSTNMETDFDDTFGEVLLNGSAITNPRQSADLFQQGDSLWLGITSTNLDLIWVGGDADPNDSVWHIDNTNNWKQLDDTPDMFAASDYVIFDNTGGERNVFVGNKTSTSQTAQVAGMKVTSDYEFSGGTILGTKPTSTGQTVTGKLEVSGTGTVAGFDNTINFVDGVNIGTGAEVALRNNGSLSDMAIENNGTLNFNKTTNDYTFGGTVTGNGTIKKTGNATVTFSEDNTSFGGNVVINAGTFALATGKQLAALSSTVNSGGTFDLGAASILDGLLDLKNGGTLISDDFATITGNADFAGKVIPNGTLIVNGDGKFFNGANYHVSLTANNSTVESTLIKGDTFEIQSGTTLTVNDTGVDISYLRSVGEVEFTVLESQTGVTGLFSTVTGYNSLFNVTHGIDGLDYYLAVQLSGNKPFEDFGYNHNTQEVADALDDGLNDSDMSDLIDEFSSMTDNEIVDMIDQLRGTELAATAQASILSSPWSRIHRKYELTDDEHMIRAFFRGQSQFKNSIRNSWGESFYRYMDTKTDGNAVKSHEQRGGIMIGTDWNFRDHSKFGVTFGYGRPSVSNRFGEVEIDDFLIGVYSRTRLFREYYVDTFVGYGSQSYDYDRRERSDRYTANYNGQSVYSSLTVSRSFRPYSGMKLTPQLGLDYAQSWNNAFTEQGAPFPKIIDKATADRTSIRVGLDTKYKIHRYFSVTGKLEYTVLVTGDKYATANSQFMMSPNSSVMELRSIDLGRNMFTAGFGVEYEISYGLKAFGNYDMDLGNRTISHSGFCGLIKKW